MSDYSNSFNGAGKDSGNDVIYGVDIDTQLDNVATASSTKSNKIVPSTTNSVATLSGTGDLQDGGFNFTNATGAITATHTELNIMDGVTITTAQLNGAPFPSGTLMLFQQTAAPTGWTKETTHNNKALRVVSGTASSGGTKAFTTTFGSGKTTDSHTLSTSQIPEHTHTITAGGGSSGPRTNLSVDSPLTDLQKTTDSTGGGSGHTHPLANFDVSYVDLIIASKDA